MMYILITICKKHRKTRYDENDISGSIAIVRNAQVIMGLNATEQEERDDILRAEIVVQRDGLPSGRALFKCSTETQRCTEFTREQRKEYDEVYSGVLDSMVIAGVKEYYEKHHHVKVSDAIVRSTVTLSERYITDRFLPDKAIDLLDESCACNECNFMRLNTMEKLYNTLKYEWPEVAVDEAIAEEAVKPIKKMLEISEKLGL